MFCVKCGKELEESVKFCPNCGNKVQGTVDISELLNTSKDKITEIGGKIKEKATDSINKIDEEKINEFVNISKEKVENISETVLEKSKETIKKIDKKKLIDSKTAIIIAIVLILGVGAFLKINVFQSPKKVVKEYVEQLKDGDLEDALEFTNAKELFGKVAVKDMIEAAEYDLGDMDYFEKEMRAFTVTNMREISRTKDICVLNITAGFPGDFETDEIVLVKEGLKWKIDLDNSYSELFDSFYY